MTSRATSSACRNPLSCIIPDYLYGQLAQKNPALRKSFEDTATLSQQIITNRPTLARLARFESAATATAGRVRKIYTADNTQILQRTLLRSEGDGPSGNAGADRVYDFFGKTYDFFQGAYGRDSIDGNGMTMVGTVDLGPNYNNAFWNGREMGFGTGDGVIFTDFTKSLDVIGHELTHGVVDFNGNGGLAYNGQVGALNESMADVFGSLVKQYIHGQDVHSADWVVGAEIMVSAPNLRSLKDPHDGLGRTPDGATPGQPKHMDEFYSGSADYYGVHVNSGIPNHAFYHFAKKLGGNAWETAGQIWYDTLTKGNLDPGVFGNHLSGEQFQSFADKTMSFAGADPAVRSALRDSWKQVGITPAGAPVSPGTGDLAAKLKAIRDELNDIIDTHL